MSLVPRLSTWRYPQPQIWRLQLSIDSRYATPVSIYRYRLLMPRLRQAADVRQQDRQTDGQTSDRYIDSTLHTMRAAPRTRPWKFRKFYEISLVFSLKILSHRASTSSCRRCSRTVRGRVWRRAPCATSWRCTSRAAEATGTSTATIATSNPASCSSMHAGTNVRDHSMINIDWNSCSTSPKTLLFSGLTPWTHDRHFYQHISVVVLVYFNYFSVLGSMH